MTVGLILVWFILWCLVKLPIPDPWRTIAIGVGLVLGVLAVFGRGLYLGLS